MDKQTKTCVIVRLCVFGAIGIIVLIAALQNTESVETRLLFATVTMPRALLLVCTFVIGAVIGAGMMFTALRRRK